LLQFVEDLGKVITIGIDVADKTDVKAVIFDEIQNPLVVRNAITGFDDDNSGHTCGFGDTIELSWKVGFVEDFVILGWPGYSFFAVGVIKVDVSVNDVFDFGESCRGFGV
jgi:hypothetical protein